MCKGDTVWLPITHTHRKTMTKYSFRNGNPSESSTVVSLSSGVILEVRRGDKTTWSASETRGRWNSLEEWKASLPAGPEPTVSADGSSSVGPDAALYLAAWTVAGKGWNTKFSTNLFCSATRGKKEARLQKKLAAAPGCAQRYIYRIKNQLYDASFLPDHKRYYAGNKFRSTVRILHPDGRFVQVCYNKKDKLFGFHPRSAAVATVAPTLEELGFVAPYQFLLETRGWPHDVDMRLLTQAAVIEEAEAMRKEKEAKEAAKAEKEAKAAEA